jgi:hypothetical protein
LHPAAIRRILSNAVKLLYYGGTFCSDETLKRLLVVAKEIAFIDRPSVKLSDASGTVGVPTFARNIEPLDPKTGIVISAHAPYKHAAQIFQEYLKRDWLSPRFRRAVLDGLSNASFVERVLQLDGNYGDATGLQIRDALLADQGLRAPVLPTLEHRTNFKIDTAAARIETFGALVTEASIMVSGGVVGAAETDSSPITDDQTLSELYAIRGMTNPDAGDGGALAILGDEIARAVLPDWVLAQLSVGDILEYRAKTKDAYDAWLGELDALVVSLEETTSEDIHAEVKRIVTASVAPKITQYKREMASVRDNMFAGLVSSAPSWILPAVALYAMTGPVVALVGALTQAGLTVGASYYSGRRNVRRSHAVSYLLRLVEEKRPLLGP